MTMSSRLRKMVEVEYSRDQRKRQELLRKCSSPLQHVQAPCERQRSDHHEHLASVATTMNI